MRRWEARQALSAPCWSQRRSLAHLFYFSSSGVGVLLPQLLTLLCSGASSGASRVPAQARQCMRGGHS